MRRFAAAVLTFAAATASVLAQESATAKPAAAAARAADVATPEAAVDALYATISGPAGQTRDWDRLRSLFHPDARLVVLAKGRGDGARAIVLTVADYIQRSGPGLERDGFFEQEIARRIDRFGDLAQVFSTYEGRRQLADQQPFLRGINSIQLVREGAQWRILQVLWEQEHDGGPIPAEYLPTRAAARPAAAAPTSLRIAGSDLMLEVMQGWAEAYGAHLPQLTVTAGGGGTSSGIQQLANGQTQAATGARRMRDEELAAVRASGFEPLEVHLADEALAICVASNNPIAALTVEQLAAIYSEGGSITKWSQLGVTLADGAADAIAPAQHQSNSGTQMLFRVLVLGQAHPRQGNRELHGSRDVATFVAAHAGAIGFCPLAYVGDGLRAVPIATAAGAAAVPPSAAAGADGSYPLLRPFYVYFRDEPSGTVKSFVDWIRGPDGRAITQRCGLVPRAK